MFLNFGFLLFISPALLLGILAQFWVRSSYARAQKVAARLSGAAAAKRILDSAGLHDVAIEEVPGRLSDHYDPRARVLRLSQDVYHRRSLAAVGIAAHEAGHAIQHARNYFPLVIRNAAVPAAGFGSSGGMLLLLLGYIFHNPALLIFGIILFSAVVFFQLVNLPVEYDASSRAKAELINLGIVDQYELPVVSKVLSAAALTYVAATLQALLTLFYYVSIFTGNRD